MKSSAIYVNVSIFTYLELVPFNLNVSIVLYAYIYQTAPGENIFGFNEENVFWFVALEDKAVNK